MQGSLDYLCKINLINFESWNDKHSFAKFNRKLIQHSYLDSII